MIVYYWSKDEFHIEGNKIIHKERWDGNKEATMTYEMKGDECTMVSWD